MESITDNFGRDAGKIWMTLDKFGPLSQSRLLKIIGLRQRDFYAAIGWLAKENKIFLNDTDYSLGETNMGYNIGEDAGKVWNIINNCGEIEFKYIPKLANISEKDTYCALGWLAKEGKISAKKIIPKKPQVRYKLK